MRSHQQKFMADLEQGMARDGLELVVDQIYDNTGTITVSFENEYEPIVKIGYQFNSGGMYATFDRVEGFNQFALENPDRADEDDRSQGRFWWYLHPDELPQILKAIRTQCARAINARREAERSAPVAESWGMTVRITDIPTSYSREEIEMSLNQALHKYLPGDAEWDTQPAPPQVYVSQNQGYVVDTWITKGTDDDVDVIFIDWSEITPDSGDFMEVQLDRLEEAAEASLRLPKDDAISNLDEMIEFLETHFDPGSGYVADYDFSKRAIQTIKDLKSHKTDLEMAIQSHVTSPQSTEDKDD